MNIPHAKRFPKGTNILVAKHKGAIRYRNRPVQIYEGIYTGPEQRGSLVKQRKRMFRPVEARDIDCAFPRELVEACKKLGQLFKELVDKESIGTKMEKMRRVAKKNNLYLFVSRTNPNNVLVHLGNSVNNGKQTVIAYDPTTDRLVWASERRIEQGKVTRLPHWPANLHHN